MAEAPLTISDRILEAATSAFNNTRKFTAGYIRQEHGGKTVIGLRTEDNIPDISRLCGAFSEISDDRQKVQAGELKSNIKDGVEEHNLEVNVFRQSEKAVPPKTQVAEAGTHTPRRYGLGVAFSGALLVATGAWLWLRIWGQDQSEEERSMWN